MADPVSAALILSAGSSVAGGISGYQKAKGEQERAQINSYIGRTRALQTDTVARQSLEDDLGSLRATLGANNQRPGVGTLEMVNELRTVRDRERRINVGNRNAEAADWRLAGANAGRAATGALVGGIIGAGPDLFDLYQYKRHG